MTQDHEKTPAYMQGYEAGLNGYCQDTCKYEDESNAYWQWIAGWCSAVDYWEGRDDCDAPATQWEVMISAI